MWMVRAGRGAALVREFEEKQYVAIGWAEIGDLTACKDRAEVQRRYQERFTEKNEGAARIRAGQIARFRFEMKKGDDILTYDPERRIYLLGAIASDYSWAPEAPGGSAHLRKVSWRARIGRDALSVTTKNSLGAISTLFLLPDEAAREILARAESPAPPAESAEPGAETLREDVAERAREFIKDRLLELDWEDMQEITAGILKAMGYKAHVAPRGADRGADIWASPDGLGLEQPRIRAEVKHREGAIGAPAVRGFLGGLRPSKRRNIFEVRYHF